MKTLFNRIERGEERVETLRKDLYQEMKDIYTKHDQATDSLRGEMNKMAISLRNAISDSSNRTNELLVKVISKND
ncbi:hypothetical protein [Pseudoalteromonas marina]|uniref:hypothetical protein n=1 Tax=Pseudoalteromonas marina TaxID=267375 RepID=UPI003C4814F7